MHPVGAPPAHARHLCASRQPLRPHPRGGNGFIRATNWWWGEQPSFHSSDVLFLHYDGIERTCFILLKSICGTLIWKFGEGMERSREMGCLQQVGVDSAPCESFLPVADVCKAPCQAL